MTWPLIELGELMSGRGTSVDPAKFQDEEFALFSVPAYDAQVPDRVLGKEIGSPKQVVQPGDVLLSKIVPHIRRAWIVPPSDDRRQIGSSEWIIFRSPNFSASYLRQLLLSDQFNSKLMQTVSGVGGSLLRARPTGVARIKIPIPPIEEQRRIAAILDKTEELRINRRAVQHELAALPHAIFRSRFGDPIANSMGWNVATIADVATQVTDGEHLTPRRTTSGIKLLSARNVQDGYLDFRDVDYIDEKEFERMSRRCNPTVGDILISCSGTIGRVAQVKSREPLGLVRSAALVRPNPELLDSTFLEYVLRAPALRRRMMQRANASSQANLFQNQIRDLPVVIPPIRDQKNFAIAIRQYQLTCDAQSSALLESSDLFKSLQAKYFSAEPLVGAA